MFITDNLRSFGRIAIRHLADVLTNTPRVNRILYESVAESITASKVDTKIIDNFYSLSRRNLFSNMKWKHGPRRVKKVTDELLAYLSGYTSIKDKTYCDLGCGTDNPFGVSTVLTLMGAQRAIALDIRPSDPNRSAEAVFDLLIDIGVNGKEWNIADLHGIVNRFDLSKLQRGDLAGIPNGMEHKVANIIDADLPIDMIDILSSRAVLEHVSDFGAACKKLFSVTAPGGLQFHHVDLVDHRIYLNSNKYNKWSFLTENDEGRYTFNQLRANEIRGYLVNVGFEILRFDSRKDDPPIDFKPASRFSSMAWEDVCTTGISFLVRKPRTC